MLVIEGMLGLGDSLHQRAIVRELLREHNEIWLGTPWPIVYQDLSRVKCYPRKTVLRTQQKSIVRSSTLYAAAQPPSASRSMRVWYTHDSVRRNGGFLSAMCADAGLPKGDFSLRVPPAWTRMAQEWLGKIDRPLMLYRPLVVRKEWEGCTARNPEIEAYVALARSVSEQFYVVSIADLVPRQEWAVSPALPADREAHRGELPFELIAGLMTLSDLVYCSPGFMLVLAQAVGARLCAVFGGHESARFYSHGNVTDLFIEPIEPCECFSKRHQCRKTINLPSALAALQEFACSAIALP